MSQETTLTIIGNITADPEVRTVGNGSTVANFTIASTPRTFNRDTNQWEDGQPLFMRCSAWRDLAKHVADSLAKGMRVIAVGRMRQTQYQAKDGSTRYSMEMTADSIGPDLMYATAQVVKQQRGQQGNGQWQQTQQATRNHAPASSQAKDDPWGAPQQNGFNGDGFGGGSNDEPEF
jgi:single-strand DNA-binding protein